MCVSYEDSPFVQRKTRLMRGTDVYMLEEDLKHLCHAQTDLRGNNLCLLWLLLPTSLCQEHAAEDQEGALRNIDWLRHLFLPPSVNCHAVSSREGERGGACGTHAQLEHIGNNARPYGKLVIS